MRRIVAPALLTLVLVLTLLVAFVPAALAGKPGSWTQVTGDGLNNSTELGLARTPDGLLHVVWAAPTPGSSPSATTSVLQRTVAQNGTLSPTSPVVQDWVGPVQDPALVQDSVKHYLLAFISGHMSLTNSGYGMFAAASQDGGATWTPASPVGAPGMGYGSRPRVLMTDNRQLLEVFCGTLGVFVHANVTTDPPFEYNNAPLGGIGDYANLAQDQGPDVHPVWIAWYRVPGPGADPGVWVNTVDPVTGAPVNTPFHLPGSSVSFQGAQQSASPDSTVPLVSRPGGGVYAAFGVGYPSVKTVRVWKLTYPGGTMTASAMDVASGGATKDNVALAVDPNGRLWAFWTQQTGAGSTVYARRSNPAATVWGATVKVAVPKAVYDIFRLAADAQAGRADLFGQFGLSGPGTAAWHTQVLPGLSLDPSKARLKAGKRYRLTFKVRDAGDPVKGSLVKVGKAKAKTGANGIVTLTVGPFRAGKVKASATAGGYVKAIALLTVRR
jgi:hypothetical protein